jgi:hypothetical protein
MLERVYHHGHDILRVRVVRDLPSSARSRAVTERLAAKHSWAVLSHAGTPAAPTPTTLFTEITARGYQGGPTLVRHYLHQFRTTTYIPQPSMKPPSVRRVVGWIMTDPVALDPADQTRLDAVLAASPSLTTLTRSRPRVRSHDD